MNDIFHKIINLAILALLPIAWTAPLLKAGLLPLFGLKEISVLSGLSALFQTDIFLALFAALFALVMPLAKTLLISAIQFKLISRTALPAARIMGKLSMVEVFLIAIYIVAIKGVGIGTVQIGWGLYLFTGCILASLAIGHLTEKSARIGGTVSNPGTMRR